MFNLANKKQIKETTHLLMARPGDDLADLRGSDDGGDWESVSHSLGHGHDVRLDPVSLKAPKVFPSSTETRLDLVRNANTTKLTSACKCSLKQSQRLARRLLLIMLTLTEMFLILP